MLKFLELRKVKDLSGYKSPITKVWFEKANEYAPQQGKEYAWVWEYAKFRFSSAAEARQSVEEKSLTTIKFVSIIGSGVWAVFVFLSARGMCVAESVKMSALLGSFSLFLAALLALLAFGPAEHRLPVNEEAALRFADRCADKEQSLGKFSLGLCASTEFENVLVSKKGALLKWSLGFLTGGVFLFIVSLACVVSR